MSAPRRRPDSYRRNAGRALDLTGLTSTRRPVSSVRASGASMTLKDMNIFNNCGLEKANP
jgi:hypothetical protein